MYTKEVVLFVPLVADVNATQPLGCAVPAKSPELKARAYTVMPLVTNPGPACHGMYNCFSHFKGSIR
ncbi:hypothetical protein ACFL3I_01935 [Pseudomonadota bacterium]